MDHGEGADRLPPFRRCSGPLPRSGQRLANPHRCRTQGMAGAAPAGLISDRAGLLKRSTDALAALLLQICWANLGVVAPVTVTPGTPGITTRGRRAMLVG